jgi:AbrB family looped-hinge helix DNA binding protein
MMTSKIGKRGTVVIPARVRESYGLDEGSQVIVEARPEGVLLRPVVTLPVEIYSARRRAEFLLNSAVTREDYSQALKKVRSMGLNPEEIPHEKLMVTKRQK